MGRYPGTSPTIGNGEIPTTMDGGDLALGDLPPRGVGPSPEMGKGGDTRGSGVGLPQNRGFLGRTECPCGGRNCGLDVSRSIGKGYQGERSGLERSGKTGIANCGML